jgi:hypothetical protein
MRWVTGSLAPGCPTESVFVAQPDARLQDSVDGLSMGRGALMDSAGCKLVRLLPSCDAKSGGRALWGRPEPSGHLGTK